MRLLATSVTVLLTTRAPDLLLRAPSPLLRAGDDLGADDLRRATEESVDLGGAGEKGRYFIAFSCDPMRFDVMLRRMFGTWEDNEHDQLIDYSTPTSGSYWFAPSEKDFAATGCIG